MYYSPEGRPLDVMEWAHLFERRFTDPDKSWWRKQSYVPGGFVSTVWIGHDMSMGFGDRALTWETMVFGSYELNEEQWRWSSGDEGFRGHRFLVRLLWMEFTMQVLIAVWVLCILAWLLPVIIG